MAIDGSINLGDIQGFGSTAWSLFAVGDPGNLTNGNSFTPEFDTAGSLEAPPELPLLFDLVASGVAGGTAQGAIRLPALSLAGGIDGPMVLPAFAAAAVGQAGILMSGAIVLTAPTLDGALDAGLRLPMPSLSAAGIAGNVASASLALPAFAVDASFGTVGVIVPELFTVAAAGLSGAVGQGGVVLPRLTATAAAYQDTTADGVIAPLAYTLTAAMEGETIIDGSIRFAPFDVIAAGATGTVASAQLTVPLVEIAADGYLSAIGEAVIELPALLIGAAAQIGGMAVETPALDPNGAPIRPAGTTIALNTRLRGVTLYEGLTANSYAQFAGVTLAATADGIVALAGDTDFGNPIVARVAGGVTDFNILEKKRVLGGYVGYRAEGDIDLTLITDEHHEFIYRLQPRQAGPDIHVTRVKFGRGIDGQYWQWAFQNRLGAHFEVDSLTLNVDPMKRRI